MKHSREQPVCGGLQPRQKRVYLCTLGAATFVVWGKAGNVAARKAEFKFDCVYRNSYIIYDRKKTICSLVALQCTYSTPRGARPI